VAAGGLICNIVNVRAPGAKVTEVLLVYAANHPAGADADNENVDTGQPALSPFTRVTETPPVPPAWIEPDGPLTDSSGLARVQPVGGLYVTLTDAPALLTASGVIVTPAHVSVYVLPVDRAG
jgi:hypothetical protein